MYLGKLINYSRFYIIYLFVNILMKIYLSSIFTILFISSNLNHIYMHEKRLWLRFNCLNHSFCLKKSIFTFPYASLHSRCNENWDVCVCFLCRNLWLFALVVSYTLDDDSRVSRLLSCKYFIILLAYAFTKNPLREYYIRLNVFCCLIKLCMQTLANIFGHITMNSLSPSSLSA